MPIAYENVKTGRIVKVLTPEEKAARSRGDAERDKRRQRKLIAKMDESAKWMRTATPDLVGRGARPAPIVDEAPDDVDEVTEPAAAPDETPDVPAKPTGPVFTRTVKRS